jgi:hypothetical protein
MWSLKRVFLSGLGVLMVSAFVVRIAVTLCGESRFLRSLWAAWTMPTSAHAAAQNERFPGLCSGGDSCGVFALWCAAAADSERQLGGLRPRAASDRERQLGWLRPTGNDSSAGCGRQ